ncbi:MAG TPA: CHRD domain-containing protein [Nitrospirales bacterium]|nr:CHRD domain-containing protein [Nitrospirales bacterium]
MPQIEPQWHIRQRQKVKNPPEQTRHAGVWQSSRMFGVLCAIALVAAFIVGGPTAILSSAGAQTFSDDTFNDADWDILAEIFIDNDARGGGDVGASQVGEGGNPGAFRQVQQALTSADDSATILAFHRNVNAVYSPSAQGAIGTIDFSIDAITFSDGSPLAVGPALLQNGGIYFSAATNTDRTWSTASLTGLTVESFFNLDFFPPNFSKTGNAIAFGFVVSSSGFADLANVEFSGGVDNWSVTVTPQAALPPPEPEPDPEPEPVPEPAPPTARPIFMATATGSQVLTSPAGGIPNNGTCVATFRPIDAGEGGNEVSYRVQCFGISGVFSAQLRLGSTLENGPIAAMLFPVGTPTGPINGLIQRDGDVSTGTVPNDISDVTGEPGDTLLDLMTQDRVYFEVISERHPSGHVRGQAVPVDDTNIVEEFFLATGSGGQQRPESIETDGRCLATFRAKGSEKLKYKLKCWGLEGVTQAHIHQGSAKETGDVLAFLFPLGEATGPVNGVIQRENGEKSNGVLSDDDVIGMTVTGLITLMNADDTYLNVHTETNQPGDVRGQVTLIKTLAGGF